MRPEPFRPAPEDLLAGLAAEPGRAGLFCDFDGTLAPIVEDPAASSPLPGAPDVLEALAASLGRVAVVSGRPARFLAAHLGGRGVELWGLYGLERVDAGGAVVTDPEAEGWRPVLDAAAEAAAAELPAGVMVEPKGLSLTLHYRRAPEAQARVGAWARRQAAATGLAVHPAKMSWELRLPLERDKGTVVRAASVGLGAVAFVGDDVGDLGAFDALDDLAAAGCHTVAVAVASAEAPTALLERADLVVAGPPAALELLRSLAQRLA